jgi:RNA polymerase sigma factor (TIGR02999 family)
LRVVRGTDHGWDHRGHFFAAAAQAMRDILVDRARRKAAVKHGGDQNRADLADAQPDIEPPSDDLLAVHEALQRLESDDPRKSQIINLRYFVGLSNEETASILGVSLGTVEREWRYIRAWLKTQLQPD